MAKVNEKEFHHLDKIINKRRRRDVITKFNKEGEEIEDFRNVARMTKFSHSVDSYSPSPVAR